MRTSFTASMAHLATFITVTIIGIATATTATSAFDPFRNSTTARITEPDTGLAFNALFEQGNYQDTEYYLRQAEAKNSKEPITYALLAALAYQQEDWNSLKSYASKTLETAQALVNSGDPLRGNLYLAVGNFLEGGYILATEGNLQGASQALKKLQVVFDYIDTAQKIDPNDPELNLAKGYMDLLLSLHLPFSSSKAAIETLKNGNPSYLADRGLAIAYRDLGQHQKALEFVNQALEKTPNNPEVLYLKAQILSALGRKDNNNSQVLGEARNNFAQALRQPERLPKRMVAQIFYEQCKTLNRLDNQSRACDPLRDQIKENQGFFGPVAEKMPAL